MCLLEELGAETSNEADKWNWKDEITLGASPIAPTGLYGE